MADRILVLRIAALLKVSGLLEALDAWCYRTIDDTAAKLTARRWQRRLRGRR
jgi:hypothetical protein